MKDKLMKLFYDYLHTVTLYHDDMPNEPFKQVVFKNEIPEITEKILSLIKSNMPKKIEICMGHRERTEAWITNGICNDCGLPVKNSELYNYYNSAIDNCMKAMG